MGPVAAPTGRTFAAVAFTWKAAAPFRPRLVAALCRRVAALRASGVDVTVLGPGGVVPDGLLRECRLVRGTPEVMRVMVAALARRGVGPGLLLLVGSEFGGPGPDAELLVPELARAAVVSVGAEPAGVPAGVAPAGGGARRLPVLLDEQVWRHSRQRVPTIDEDSAWIVCETEAGSLRRRVTESLFTLGAEGVATRGSVEEAAPGAQPLVLATGVYEGTGCGQHLLPGPVWTRLAVEPARFVIAGSSSARSWRTVLFRCGPCGWPVSPSPAWSPCAPRRRPPGCQGRVVRCGGRRGSRWLPGARMASTGRGPARTTGRGSPPWRSNGPGATARFAPCSEWPRTPSAARAGGTCARRPMRCARPTASASGGCSPISGRPGPAAGMPSTSRSAVIPRPSWHSGSRCSSCGA